MARARTGALEASRHRMRTAHRVAGPERDLQGLSRIVERCGNVRPGMSV